MQRKSNIAEMAWTYRKNKEGRVALCRWIWRSDSTRPEGRPRKR